MGCGDGVALLFQLLYSQCLVLPHLGDWFLYWLTQPQVVLVHRNTKASTAFLPEVSELLHSVSFTSPSTHFNIQMDSISCSCATNFFFLTITI